MSQLNVSLPSDGDTIDSSDYNTPINTIVTDYNGNIDNSNIAAAAAIAGTKLADASIPAAKIDASTIIRFAVTKSASQTGITSATLTQVSFNTEEYDIGSAFASNVFTAPVAGLYHFSSSVQLQATTTGNTTGWNISLRKNGSAFRGGARFFDNNISADNATAVVSGDILLTASETVDVAASCTASAGNVQFNTSVDTFFTGHLVVRT